MAVAAAAVGGVALLHGVTKSVGDASAAKQQGKYQEMVGNLNAQMADDAGRDALKRGAEEVFAIKKNAKRAVGSQRAALAAQGIVVDDGSALDVQLDTARSAEIDSMTARNNAWREAYGYKVQAISDSAGGKLANIAAQNQARGTLIAGGVNAANSAASIYQTYNYGKGSK